MKRFQIHYDREYGIDKLSGWSICVNGRFVATFERWLIVAILKAIFKSVKHGL